MENLKNKMYDYEVVPPKNAWEAISTSLDKNETVPVISIKRIKSKPLFYALAAASIVVAVLTITFSLLFSSTNKHEQLTSVISSNKTSSQIANNYTLKKISAEAKLNALSGNNSSSEKKSDTGKDNLTTEGKSKIYITIAGPEGQPVKISSKVATLIESSDNKYPPNAVWSSKINKWKNIMLANTLTPTATNFLDIAELTKTLGDKDN